jgi:hypothetical protein
MADNEGGEDDNVLSAEESGILFGNQGDDLLFDDGDLEAIFAAAGNDNLIPDSSEGGEVRLNDFISEAEGELDGSGPALFIDGENTDAFILAEPEDVSDILGDGILFI